MQFSKFVIRRQWNCPAKRWQFITNIIESVNFSLNCKCSSKRDWFSLKALHQQRPFSPTTETCLKSSIEQEQYLQFGFCARQWGHFQTAITSERKKFTELFRQEVDPKWSKWAPYVIIYPSHFEFWLIWGQIEWDCDGNFVLDILEPPGFQKYNTFWVFLLKVIFHVKPPGFQ